MLGKTFGPKEVSVIRDCRKLHNEDLRDLYCSHVIRVNRSRMIWAVLVAHMW